MFSGLPLRADIVRCSWHVAKVPDAADFRKTREARFDKPLEEVVAGRGDRSRIFAGRLPMRLTLNTKSCLGGEMPNHADLSRKVIFRGSISAPQARRAVAQASR
jgi:hypothetical protein